MAQGGGPDGDQRWQRFASVRAALEGLGRRPRSHRGFPFSPLRAICLPLF